jgi:hypothetical protein
MKHYSLAYLTFAFSLLILQTVNAAHNITVDDTDSRIMYLPESAWLHVSTLLFDSF